MISELHGRVVFRNPRTVETHENQTFIVDYGNDHKFIISGFSLEPLPALPSDEVIFPFKTN